MYLHAIVMCRGLSSVQVSLYGDIKLSYVHSFWKSYVQDFKSWNIQRGANIQRGSSPHVFPMPSYSSFWRKPGRTGVRLYNNCFILFLTNVCYPPQGNWRVNLPPHPLKNKYLWCHKLVGIGATCGCSMCSMLLHMMSQVNNFEHTGLDMDHLKQLFGACSKSSDLQYIDSPTCYRAEW